MPENTLRSAFADLHGGGGKVNEPLDEPGIGSRPAKGVPETLPDFVSFPGVAVIEQVEGMEPPGMRGEDRGNGSAAGGRASC